MSKRFILTATFIGLFTFVIAPMANAQSAPFPERAVEVDIDSGILVNNGTESEVIWSEVIHNPEAVWIRLSFEQAQLARQNEALKSSVIRITSLDDFATQHLNWITIDQWHNTSAYFNGDSVLIELIAAPNGLDNHITISEITIGIEDEQVGIETICGPTDDRELSEVARSSRLMNSGCTCWLIDDPHHQFLTAGHCSGSMSVTEFNVPLSDSNGNIRHPGPEDQYPIDLSSVQYVYGGVGDDWCYFACFPNSETGLTAYMAQGDFYELADSAPPVNGQDIRITGYGTVSNPVPREWNQVQKTHAGPYYDRYGTTVQYQTDTSGGNSGSAVFNEEDGTAIGIHTHGGCYNGGGANYGTAIQNSGLQNALANPQGRCDFFQLDVPTLYAGQQATLTASDTTPGFTVYFIYSLAGEGETLVEVLGVTLGIVNPILAGSDVSNASGEAVLQRQVPNGSAGTVLWIQAAEIGRSSKVIPSQIN